MRINVGIRRRLAPLVDNSRRRIELLNSLLFSMPGTPIIYYGDEIGMGDNVYLGDRNGVRTPMQWTGDRNAGFSTADIHALYAPLVADPVYGYQAVNVEAQERIPGRCCNWMKRMIGVRKQYPVFGRGSLEFLHPENRRVLAYLREHDGVTVLCVANLSRFAQYVELDLSALRGPRAGRAHRPRPASRRSASCPTCSRWVPTTSTGSSSPRTDERHDRPARHDRRCRGHGRRRRTGVRGHVPGDRARSCPRRVDRRGTVGLALRLRESGARQPGPRMGRVRDGSIVGYATTSPAKDTWLPPPAGAGELTNLYLDPDVIGSGVGRLLYEHAVDDLRERGFDPLVVWAFRDNPRAAAFYPRMGLAIDVADHALGARRRPVPDRALPWRPGRRRVGMTPEEIAAARWFRSKHLPVAAVVEIDRATIAPDASLAVVEVRFAADAPPERYLVPRARHGQPAWPRR